MANEIIKNVTNTGRIITQRIPAGSAVVLTSFNPSTVSFNSYSPGPTLNMRNGITSTAVGATAQILIPSPPVNTTLASITMDYIIAGSNRTPATNRLGIVLVKSKPSGSVSLFSTSFQPVTLYATTGTGVNTSTTWNPDQSGLIDNTFEYNIFVIEESGTGAPSPPGNTVYGFTLTYQATYS